MLDRGGSADQGVTGGLSRRRFLASSLACGAASLLTGAVTEELLSPVLLAQSNVTPDQAIKELMDGNARFVDDHLTGFRDLKAQRERTAEKQEPFAAVLACADSRVPVEVIFDQGIGHIFVSRVAGNVVTPEIIGSLEYGAAVLGTKAILVLGHSSCGAVKAKMSGKPVPGQISSLFPHIQPAVDQTGHDLEAAIKANARIQADLLGKASPVLSEMLKDGKLKIVSGYYDLASGKVTLL